MRSSANCPTPFYKLLFRLMARPSFANKCLCLSIDSQPPLHLLQRDPFRLRINKQHNEVECPA